MKPMVSSLFRDRLVTSCERVTVVADPADQIHTPKRGTPLCSLHARHRHTRSKRTVAPRSRWRAGRQRQRRCFSPRPGARAGRWPRGEAAPPAPVETRPSGAAPSAAARGRLIFLVPSPVPVSARRAAVARAGPMADAHPSLSPLGSSGPVVVW